MPDSPPSIEIRPATVDDVALILRFIRELAACERAEQEVVATEEPARDAVRRGRASPGPGLPRGRRGRRALRVLLQLLHGRMGALPPGGRGAGGVRARQGARNPGVARRHAPLGDFKLESGETIRDFSISYVTHGTLDADRSNAILMVTAIGGNHHRIDYLIGSGRALDPSKYFIIATDAIGNGLTTSPSNSKAQARMQCPRFNLRDMVNSQQRLVTEEFGIRKLVTVVGASMGGMQALQWEVSDPDMMQSVEPIIPLARTPAWTTGVLEMLRQSIMTGPQGPLAALCFVCA